MRRVGARVVLQHGERRLGVGEPLVLVAADPHEREPLADARFHQPRGGDDRQAPTAREIQRDIGVVTHRFRDDCFGSGADRRSASCEAVVGAGEQRHVFATGERQQPRSLLERAFDLMPGLTGDVVARQLRADHAAEIHRRAEQVMGELHEPVGISAVVVVADHAGTAQRGLDGVQPRLFGGGCGL